MMRWLIGLLMGDRAAELREVQRFVLRNEAGCPTWLLLFGSAALVALSVWLYRRQPLSPRRRATLAVLRGLAYVALLGVLVRPLVSLEGLAEVRGRLLILLDGTESMSIQDVRDGGRTISRFEAGKRTMKHLMGRRAALEASTLPAYYLYREQVERLDPEKPQALDALAPAGAQTSLVQAIAQMRKEHAGEPIAAVWLITDGMHNAGEFVENTVEDLKGEGVRILATGLGLPEARDIALSHIFAEDVVFVDERAAFLLKLQQAGFGGQEIRVTLSIDGAPAGAKSFTLEGAREQTVEFRCDRPLAVGKHRFRFEVEPKPDEMVTKNNALDRTLDVIDAQIRVLLAYGAPDWEYRYLKGALERDKRVRLTVFLEEMDRRVFAAPAPGLLKTFPEANREFANRYDLVILGQIHAGMLSTPQLEMLRDFVGEEGGALVLIADPASVPGSFQGTPLEPLVPVVFTGGRGRTLKDELTSPLREEIPVRLTEEGRSHPLMRLEDDPQENEKVWAGLPPHYWGFSADGLKPSALALLAARGDRGKGDPLVVTHAFGRGSVLLMGIRDTWRWRYQVGETHFRRFWGQVVQYLGLPHLTGAATLTTLTTDKRTYLAGEKVQVTARVLNADFSPSTAAKVAVRVETAAGGDPATLELAALPGRRGLFQGAWLARREGEYAVAVPGDPACRPAAFTVRELQREFRYPEMNQRLLQAAAQATGGRLLGFSAEPDVKEALGVARKVVPAKFDERLWDTWPALLACVFLLALEWFLRKRWYLD